jgi:hypothetical protein
MTTIGFLHTSPVHVPTFTALVRELSPNATDIHVVREDLLARARAGEAYEIDLTELQDADIIVCTCSTIGASAERAGGAATVRVDRPMAAQAVRYAKVAVVAALASTVEPTMDLLREEAAKAGTTPKLTLVDAGSAWPFFEAGDLAGYHEAIADHIRALDADVVVLAQASMAPAAVLVPQVNTLASPRSAVEYAIRAAQEGHPRQ